MPLIRSFSNRALVWSLVIMGLLAALTATVAFMALNFTATHLGAMPATDHPALLELQAAISVAGKYCLPAIISVFLVAALLLWACLRFSLRQIMKQFPAPVITPSAAARIKAAKTGKAADKPAPAQDPAAILRREKRLFLHLFSMLQEKGRLLDFLNERLDDYEDDQIGAAVRTIHGDCKAVLDKYLKLEPVVNEEEESTITLPEGFDPNAVKLTGNVVGDPPFKGVVRHRGWRVIHFDLPALSGDRDPGIVAPAEVEIP